MDENNIVILGDIYLWSVPLSVVRENLPNYIIPWFHRLYLFPVHTFATVGEYWNTEELNHKGYWYCAGDYVSADTVAINKEELGFSNITFAECLVKSGVHKDNSKHEIDVIGGTYGISYVCHNIANRVLFSTGEDRTLAKTNLNLTGYALIVKSYLGIYGTNRAEWLFRIDRCNCFLDDPIDIRKVSTREPFNSKKVEVSQIHNKASNGDETKGAEITNSLENIDKTFEVESNDIHERFVKGSITESEFHDLMYESAVQLLLATESALGKEVSINIYGNYYLDFSAPNETEKPELAEM